MSADTEVKGLDEDEKNENIIQVELKDNKGYKVIPTDLDVANDKDVVSVLCISDTHSLHKEIDIDKYKQTNKKREIVSYDQWVGELKKRQICKESILIAGNHDVTLDEPYYEKTGRKKFHGRSDQDAKACLKAITNSVYLKDQSYETMGTFQFVAL
ncbi:hypothetical protein RFI_17736 [Reticulomyxa filosa]|uniref:Calcineurin-like phosphoesterase domain-containing protein n=1 Tax=Reticulomyxa filosa TaxID=46433 RepID=X6N0B8_RETFI|nr:hypothetical protein RFI_17736 [Reticulomyxa filosa]|eukprot:ETO19496.1 hypothetical protein RFI_17736 [Reticulomyxa filosa]